jgi:hypothetical protein
LLVALFCLPFDHWAMAEEAGLRWRGPWSRPPLVAFYTGTELNAVTQMMRKTLLFVPLGSLLAFQLLAAKSGSQLSRRQWLLAAAAGTLLAAGVEVLQVWLPPHVPDFTDAAFCVLGVNIGLWIIQQAVQPSGDLGTKETLSSVDSRSLSVPAPAVIVGQLDDDFDEAGFFPHEDSSTPV